MAGTDVGAAPCETVTAVVVEVGAGTRLTDGAGTKLGSGSLIVFRAESSLCRASLLAGFSTGLAASYHLSVAGGPTIARTGASPSSFSCWTMAAAGAYDPRANVVSMVARSGPGFVTFELSVRFNAGAFVEVCSIDWFSTGNRVTTPIVEP